MICEMRRRCGSAGFGALVVFIGLLWLAQRLGWFPQGIFGPLLVVVIGGWICIAHYFLKRKDDPGEGKAGSCFLTGGHEHGREDR